MLLSLIQHDVPRMTEPKRPRRVKPLRTIEDIVALIPDGRRFADDEDCFTPASVTMRWKSLIGAPYVDNAIWIASRFFKFIVRPGLSLTPSLKPIDVGFALFSDNQKTYAAPVLFRDLFRTDTREIGLAGFFRVPRALADAASLCELDALRDDVNPIEKRRPRTSITTRIGLSEAQIIEIFEKILWLDPNCRNAPIEVFTYLNCPDNLSSSVFDRGEAGEFLAVKCSDDTQNEFFSMTIDSSVKTLLTSAFDIIQPMGADPIRTGIASGRKHSYRYTGGKLKFIINRPLHSAALAVGQALRREREYPKDIAAFFLAHGRRVTIPHLVKSTLAA